MTEKRLWIFFGIHTANAVCMIEKVEKKKRKAANLTKITGKTGEVLTSPKKDMYIMHGRGQRNNN